MNAIRKKDGYFMRLSDYVYDQDGTEYEWDEVDLVINGNLLSDIKPVDWNILRNQAAIAAMQGIMGFFGSLDYNRETIAELAVKQADALIEEIKKGMWEK